MKKSTRLSLSMPIFVVLLFTGINTRAQLSAALAYKPERTDTLLNYPFANNKFTAFTTPDAKALSVYDQEDELELQKTVATNLSKTEERKQLMEYLKQLELGNQTQSNESKNKTLFKFANLFARLKLYPLAMKCFFKTLQNGKKNAHVNATDSTYNTYDDFNYDLPITTKDDSLTFIQSQQVKNEKSERTTYEHIAGTFNDGKTAIAYALLFHIKQPVPGKRKIFVLSNTGHAYITLIKYNTDSTYVSCSFGFYPKKDHLFSGTPWFPSSSSQLKNDGGHAWDEVIGKFISKKKFDKILTLTKKYGDVQYHLNKNNCTDFSLNAAMLAGISISNTTGSWPLGHGNNPGVTGQSLINGNYSNTDGHAATTLFKSINTSVAQ
ncbi:hypothetical protein ACFQZX_00895 [Mucilaginibacter litoreus]|uniref:Permuted papain-like amidase enzyme, YaeF/YiiX, C92 family n=1 Tax=Mucilaginibacter litoreus TaxID=1048221 RepID=A0ABW3APA1_9SPHI